MMWQWEAVKDFGMVFYENNCAIIVPFSLFILLKIKLLIEMSTVIVKSKNQLPSFSFAVFEVMMKCYLFFSFFYSDPHLHRSFLHFRSRSVFLESFSVGKRQPSIKFLKVRRLE